MRAVVCREWGGPEGLNLEEVADPGSLAPDQVRIAIKAAGINFADTLMIRGKYQVKPEFPFSPGLEVAGVVEEVGSAVAGLSPGDRVMALLDHGGYAERALARATDVFRLPDTMDFETAAGFPIAYGTSHIALWERAGLKAGEMLVVHGAAGGVGLTAVEIGKAMGATVIATAGSADKLAVAAGRGADHLIDYKTEDIRLRVKELTGGAGADVIYDPVGGDVFDTSLRCVAWGGRLLVIGFAEGRIPQIPANLLLVKNIAAIGVHWGAYRQHAPGTIAESFKALFALHEAGSIRPHVSHRLPLAEFRDAMALLIERRSTGKVVLVTES
ncbi:NADPH:quinone oxidoreductase [Skermanella stibiiresistens SB22]|uniref:NADPH:quinone oxidoreductase n=1 Tax=Skermanella stibiiresistens SB22 TaxID=1385369 RepID=W9H2Z7_9PROT|nr:NADPH:quinone oxidoreductase family protein [Skermanella stibiiresistens]EWY39151.1 NADPH:quinone oxidoreductase [Skermanella stibiiresistens SB22]